MLRAHFRPEFLNRVDEVIVFHALTDADLEQIVGLLLADLDRRLAEQDLSLELTPAARALIVREGTDPAYGARPLKRTIQRLVENPLARALVSGQFKPGDRITRRRGPRIRDDRVLHGGDDRGDRERLASRRARPAPATKPTRSARPPARAAVGSPARSTCRRPSASAATASWSTEGRTPDGAVRSRRPAPGRPAGAPAGAGGRPDADHRRRPGSAPTTDAAGRPAGTPGGACSCCSIPTRRAWPGSC